MGSALLVAGSLAYSGYCALAVQRSAAEDLASNQLYLISSLLWLLGTAFLIHSSYPERVAGIVALLTRALTLTLTLIRTLARALALTLTLTRALTLPLPLTLTPNPNQGSSPKRSATRATRHASRPWAPSSATRPPPPSSSAHGPHPTPTPTLTLTVTLTLILTLTLTSILT